MVGVRWSPSADETRLRCHEPQVVAIAFAYRFADGSAHIDATDCFQAGSRWVDPKPPGLLPTLDTAPKLLLRGQQQVLVQRVRTDNHLDPFAAPGNDGKGG